MAPRWTEEMTTKFLLEVYRDRPCLWQKFSDIYKKDKNAREAVLTAIASKMNIEGFGILEVKTERKPLRTSTLTK